MRLYVLNGGQLFVEKGFFWHFGTEADTGRDYEPEMKVLRSLQFYIDHPAAKIVFELGYDYADFSTFTGFPHRQGPGGEWCHQEADENPMAQLGKIGVSVEDIDYVVLSHLMSEHVGYLPFFAGTKAEIIVQQAEYDYANRIGTPRRPGEEPALEQFHSWMYVRKLFEQPGLNWKLIAGDYDLVGRDVQILSLPGHTPGFQAVIARLPHTGTVVLSGCETQDMYYGIPVRGHGPGIPHAFTWSAAEELASLKRVRELVAAEGGQIFCGHDGEQFRTLRKSPEYYD